MNNFAAPTPPVNYAAYRAQVAQMPAPATPQGATPVVPQTAVLTVPQAPAPTAPQANSAEVEKWIGSKLVGTLAALLVLCGLIILGVSFIPQLPSIVKATFIALFALALTAAGCVLVMRNRNAFSYALFACGLVAVFVAIFVTHFHFALISHNAALVVAGIWMAITVALVRLTRSWVLCIALLAMAGLAGITFLEGEGSQLHYAAAFILDVVYCIALGVLGIKLAEQPATRSATLSPIQRLQSVRTKALVSLFTAEGAIYFAAALSSWQYSGECALVFLTAILLVLKCTHLPQALQENLFALRINEIVILFFTAIAFLFSNFWGNFATIPTLILDGLATAAVIVLAGLRVLDLAKPHMLRAHSALVVLFACAASGVVIEYFAHVARVLSSPYAWSAACMALALIAVFVGFRFGEKPLRIYGLVVTLCCVLKIALFDISGDALIHAIALVVAGIVCFAISALYTYSSKKVG